MRGAMNMRGCEPIDAGHPPTRVRKMVKRCAPVRAKTNNEDVEGFCHLNVPDEVSYIRRITTFDPKFPFREIKTRPPVLTSLIISPLQFGTCLAIRSRN